MQLRKPFRQRHTQRLKIVRIEGAGGETCARDLLLELLTEPVLQDGIFIREVPIKSHPIDFRSLRNILDGNRRKSLFCEELSKGMHQDLPRAFHSWIFFPISHQRNLLWLV